jgi:tRNA uridine 5-carboxymethylaminomethyl modification enzyme
MSITLPEEVQQLVLRSCKGLEQVEMIQPGYGVEYDYVNPRELKGAPPPSLSRSDRQRGDDG